MYTVASSSTQAVSYTEKNIVTQKSKTPISVAKNDMQIASSPEDKLTNTINKSEITKDKAKITKDSTSDTKKENKPEVSSSAVDDIIAAMQNSKSLHNYS